MCKNFLNNIKNIHFIGIGGCGMSGLACYFKDLGFYITGSDIKNTDTIKYLKDQKKIKIFKKHASENVENADLIVYSSAIKSDNIEMISAIKKSKLLLKRAQVLNILLNDKFNISIAGTHGKTTVSAMITHILDYNGKKPSAIIGGVLNDYNKSYLFSKKNIFVVEADESDGTLELYHSDIAVITNIGLDHMDFFNSENKIFEVFKKYIENIKKNGYCILNIDDVNIKKIIKYIKNINIIKYGFSSDADIKAIDYKISNGSSILKLKVKNEIFDFKLPIIGKYNIENALSAFGCGYVMNIEIQKIIKAMSNFPGVKRRMSKIFEDKHLMIIDDYAHNPVKINSSISAVRKSWPEYKLIVIFQPHRYSRMKTLYDDFVISFKKTDLCIVTPIYSAGETNTFNLNIKNISNDISKFSKINSRYVFDLDEIINICKPYFKSKSIVLTLGAGDIDKFAKNFQKKYKKI